MARSVWFFGNGKADGSREMKRELGSKGANLAEMTNLGIPVPPGFTIGTAECMQYLRDGSIAVTLRADIDEALRRLERCTGKGFGDPTNPLLLSVRSGGAVSMPGMMETVLNLGLNADTVHGLATASGNPRFALDAYRRFVQMYANVVLGVPDAPFEQALDRKRTSTNAAHDSDLPVEALQSLVSEYLRLVRDATGSDFPVDPRTQLWGAIEAVWKSWTLKKATDYRKVNGIPHDMGTGVNIMTMVFGNVGDDSGTGVAFTRDPSTGERRLYGEFLVNAQGEDVVAGIRTPLHLDDMATRLPAAHERLLILQRAIEQHYRDMQDIEFTVEHGTLYILQTRTGKRTTPAAMRIALDMVAEGLITKEEALRRIQPDQLDQLLHRVISTEAQVAPLATGLPASPGAASGIVVFDSETAERRHRAGEQVVLVREETTPEDFHGIVAAHAVLTARGGMTSHAAVVARGMGKCAIVGCSSLVIMADQHRMTLDGTAINEGEWITLDGGTGRVFQGNLPTQPSEVLRVAEGTMPAAESPLYQQFAKLMTWADDVRTIRVRANADTPHDASLARNFGAEGIGLCRTEHMFFEQDRLTTMQEMIVARDEGGRRRALEKLLPMQRTDFEGIFQAMDGFPVTIRLLDPPLHEFLPKDDEASARLAQSLGMNRQDLARVIGSLRETNPMLGHRGCRLGIVFPEITEMQARAIFEAALRAFRRGIKVHPEIMIPLIADVAEFRHQRAIILQVASQVLGTMAKELPFLIGTMIELPRAALTAGEIAREADFFSFGTNDLTQTTLGLSRDDAGRFLPLYLDRGIFSADPFRTLDLKGVGTLISAAVRDGRDARPALKVGICGEHGGDPASVHFFNRTGFDYVSCSPFRVPVARLAAAQAALEQRPRTVASLAQAASAAAVG